METPREQEKKQKVTCVVIGILIGLVIKDKRKKSDQYGTAQKLYKRTLRGLP